MENLNKFGYQFQIKSISSLLQGPDFISQTYDILDPEYYESDAARWIVKNIFEYYLEYKKSPTLEFFKVKTDGVNNDLLKVEIINFLKDVFRHLEAPDLDFVKKEVLNFCLNQELKKAILTSVDLINLGKYDDIRSVIDRALRKGQNFDVGLDYMVDVDKRYNEDNRTPVTTGWDPIDEIMQGGLSKGELGVIIAPSGIGKSWALSHIGAAAIKKGKTVVHYSLELVEGYVGIRYDCVLTGIEISNLKYHIDVVKERISKIPGKLIIKWYGVRSVSLVGLRSHLDKLKATGISPDLIILDYADLLKLPQSEKKHEALQTLYEELRGMAAEYELPIWTVSQTQRSALEEDIIESDKISESYGKVMTADFIASLSRKTQDKLSNVARLHIVKNRFGPDGITFPVSMDTNIGTFNIYSGQSDSGKEVTKQMKTDTEFQKEYLKRRVAQLNSKF